jgi:hypothetical protein
MPERDAIIFPEYRGAMEQSKAKGFGGTRGLGSIAEGTQARAQAEAGDALVEPYAAAVLQAAKEFEDALHFGQALLQFSDFAGGEFAPAGGYRSFFAEAGEEELDFSKGEIHLGGETDEQDAVECVRGIAALAVAAIWRGEQAELFVIANGRRIHGSTFGEFSDFHAFLFMRGLEGFALRRRGKRAFRSAGASPTAKESYLT